MQNHQLYLIYIILVFISGERKFRKISIVSTMPPKFYSKGKRPYSNNNYSNKTKKESKTNITFLLVGNNMVGVDVPYTLINKDQGLKKIIKNHQAVWDRDQRMWVLTHKNYHNLLDDMLQYCKSNQYYCTKIPSFVYDAQLEMPLELLVKIGKQHQPYSIRYIDVEVHIDPETLPFYSKLYDFQKESLKFGIQHHGRMLLADEMGVGKTIQSLAIAFIYRHEWPMVIICPSTLRYNWQNQVLRWYGDYIKKNQVNVYTKGGSTIKQSTKILIISYELAWKFKEVWSDFKIAIADQAHYLKNSGCKRSDILVPELAKKRRVILLTGTPAFARPREIFNLSSIIRPDVFYNFVQFANRYCQPTRNPWSGAIQYNGCANTKELFFLLKDKIMLRRLKCQVLTQLPDKQRQKIIIQTNKSIVKQINDLMDNNKNDNKNSQDFIMQMFGFKGLGGQHNEDYQKKRQSLMEAYRLSGTAKLDGVVQYILSLLENDVKLLIFAHHRIILDRIQSQLNSKKYKSIRIDGQVAMQERQNRVDQFQSKKDVMAALLSISAAGVGLTLTASSTVVFAELHWTPGMLIQAEDRAHRIGQKNCVNCHYLIGQGTLDTLLYNYLLKKINNVSTFIDGLQKNLQMQQLSKGQKGKYSKQAHSDNKNTKKQTSQKRQSFRLNPIRKQARQIKQNYETNSQATDISSQLNNCPFQDNCGSEQTISLKSRKNRKKTGNNQVIDEQQIINASKIKSKISILAGRVAELRKQDQNADSLKTSDILQLIDSAKPDQNQRNRSSRQSNNSIRQTKSSKNVIQITKNAEDIDISRHSQDDISSNSQKK